MAADPFVVVLAHHLVTLVHSSVAQSPWKVQSMGPVEGHCRRRPCCNHHFLRLHQVMVVERVEVSLEVLAVAVDFFLEQE